MNILILKDKSSFESMSDEQILNADFVGYWKDNKMLKICKDRFFGRVGLDIHANFLNEYMKKIA